MRIVFFGTPEFATHFLASLHEDKDILVAAVVCQPDKPAGRKQTLTPPPTKTYAVAHGIPVLQPASLKKDPRVVDELCALQPDAFVIVAYGKILPTSVLAIPKLGNVNVHPSLLPKYRGPSPIQSAIASGERTTGISIMLIDEEMDHGPILAQAPLPIDDRETPDTLREKIVHLGAPLLVKTLKDFAAGTIQPKEQDHTAATFCKLLTKEDGRIDWTKPAHAIDAQIRGYAPWPGAWTIWDGKLLKIHAAMVAAETVQPLEPGMVLTDHQLLVGTGTVPLRVQELQLEGKQKMDAQTFVNGYAFIKNARLA